jgi:hypothetical protein
MDEFLANDPTLLNTQTGFWDMGKTGRICEITNHRTIGDTHWTFVRNCIHPGIEQFGAKEDTGSSNLLSRKSQRINTTMGRSCGESVVDL